MGSVRWARGSPPARTTALSLRRSPRYPVILLSSPRRLGVMRANGELRTLARRDAGMRRPIPSRLPSRFAIMRPISRAKSHPDEATHGRCEPRPHRPGQSHYMQRWSASAQPVPICQTSLKSRHPRGIGEPARIMGRRPYVRPTMPEQWSRTAYDRRPSRRTPTRRVCRLPTGPPTTPARAHRSLRRVQRPRGEVFVDELARQSDAGVRGQPRDSGRAATPTGAGCPEASAARCCPCPRSRWRTARRRRAISSLRSVPQRSTARRRRGAAWLVRRAASCKHGTGADGARDGARGGRRRVAAGRHRGLARRDRTRPSG